ncbi:MAG: tetratricopeptide repeat protein, partial [Pyrinomonadaceae bacterium]
ISSVYFNLGITHSRQKKAKEAREAFKKAIEHDFAYPSPHFHLSINFYISGYRVPAFLAAARFVTLELNTQRTSNAVKLLLEILRLPQKNEKDKIVIAINPQQLEQRDEGNFTFYDTFILPTLTVVKDKKDKNKSEIEIFADAFERLMEILIEDEEIATTFVGKNYIPFFAEAKNRGYLKIHAYLILQQNGNKEAEKWLLDRESKVVEFVRWAREYKK